MRRFAMVGAVLTVGTVLGVLAPAAGSTAAWADGPQHVKSTFTFETHRAADAMPRTAVPPPIPPPDPCRMRFPEAPPRRTYQFDLAAAAVSAEDVALLWEVGCFCGC
jgi:hypothetical protein